MTLRTLRMAHWISDTLTCPLGASSSGSIAITLTARPWLLLAVLSQARHEKCHAAECQCAKGSGTAREAPTRSPRVVLNVVKAPWQWACETRGMQMTADILVVAEQRVASWATTNSLSKVYWLGSTGRLCGRRPAQRSVPLLPSE
jgi:hypothetical protein